MFAVGDLILYIIYLASFLVGMMMFSSKNALRPRQFLRQTLFLLGALILCVLLSFRGKQSFLMERWGYIVLSVYATLWFVFTYKVGWLRFVYTFCSGQLVGQVYSRLCSALIFLGGWSDQYQPQNILPMLFIRLFIYSLLYPVLYFLLARRIAADEKFEQHPLATLLMGTLTGMLLSYFGEVGTVLREQGASEYLEICSLQALFCITMLAFFYTMWNDAHRLAQEHAEAEIHRVRVEQLNVLNDVITDVNIRIHDLKHQLAHPSQPKAMQELASTIKGYDAFVFTGDDELDMILTSKNVQCIAHGITTVFSVDGKALSMLSATEKASLFGNAIDNAINYLQTVEKERRFLTVTCSANIGMVCLTFRNYLEGEIHFDSSGLPQTTHKDTRHHGFGTRSIRQIAQNHSGAAAFQVEDGSFTVSIVLPQNDQLSC